MRACRVKRKNAPYVDLRNRWEPSTMAYEWNREVKRKRNSIISITLYILLVASLIAALFCLYCSCSNA